MLKLAIACVLASSACAAWPGEIVFSWDKVFREGMFDAAGERVLASTLRGRLIGIYFAEATSPECRAFTPKLIAFSEKYEKGIVVVFISSDISAEDMAKHMKDTGMPWPALPWRCKSADKLKKENQISRVPKLLIFSTRGKLLTKEGIEDITANNVGALEKWVGIMVMLKDKE